MKKRISIDVLNLYYEYDKEFGLMDEPWGQKKDRESVTSDQIRIFEEYIDVIEFLKVENLHSDLRDKYNARAKNLEQYFEDEVLDILKR